MKQIQPCQTFSYKKVKSRLCENSLADFHTSALKINLIYPKKADGQAFKISKVH